MHIPKQLTTKHAQSNETIERKEFAFEIKAKGKPDSDGMFRFEAYGSTFGNIDLGDDVIVQGAFAESLKEQTPTILWQHNWDQPIGVPEQIVEDKVGLKLNVVMPADDDFVAKRVMPQLRIGSIKAMSIGFRVLDFHIKEGIRYITKAKLKEASLVTFPMNEQAVVTAVKCANHVEALGFAERNHPWNMKEAQERLKEFTDSKEHAGKHYASNFMAKDLAVDDEFNCFKMGFVDVVGNKRVIVPRALFAIKGMLLSEKGADYLQKSDKSRISKLIDAYIAKLNSEHGITMLNVNDLKKLTKRALEEKLRDSGAFSKDAAVIVASGFQEAGDPPTEDEATLKALNKILGNPDADDAKTLSVDALTKLENMVK